MIKGIVYTSNTGTTEEYAKLLGEKINLPVYNLKSCEALSKNSDIIYLGWLRASEIVGYKKAKVKYNIKALCGVCMGETGSQIEDVRKRNFLQEDMPLFTMQGGFDINKLHGIYRIIMKLMKRTIGKTLSRKVHRNEEEEKMLNMMLHGGHYVSEDNMKGILDWYATEK